MKDLHTHYNILVISDYRSVNSSRPEAEIFISLAGKGHSVVIISFPDAVYYNQRFRENGIEVIEKHPTKKFSLEFVRFLSRLVKEKKIDFLHAFNSQGLVNATWALQGSATKLITYRGYAGQTHWYDPMMYLKYFHPRVDHIICLSDEIREILSNNMPWAKNKLTTIHKGHHPDWYQGVSRADRSAFGFSNDDVLICFVANVRPFKGLTYLLQATHKIRKGLPLQFIFIGNGYDDSEIQKQIAQSPYAKQIHLLGYRKDSLSIVAMSDGFVLPSTHGEALTKSLIEAMSLEVAPVISDIKGNEGVVIHGESGWVVPAKDPTALANALEELITNPMERKRRGENAKVQIATHFHTDKTVDEFLLLYAKLKR